MEGLQLIVVIGAAIIGGGWLARRLRLPPALVLLLFGVAIGFIPVAGAVALPPDLVLLLFLPALLYWESVTTSLREIRSNLRVILLAAIGLVLVTAVGVGAAASALGLPWPIALALGAILAPTDATAVASVARGLPRRILTTVRTESLINDGTALVLYSVAIGAAVSGTGIEIGPVALEFLWSYLVAIAIGLAIGFVIGWLRRFVREPSLVNTLVVLTPFVAFLPAELLHASGVVAVVVCGLVSSHLPDFDASAVARRQGFGFWEVTTYILNGSLFVLIGIQFHLIVTSIEAVDWPLTLLLSGVAIVLVLGIRLAWFNTIPYVLRAVDRRPAQRARRVHARQRFPGAWAGFRGAVSLAAALALPLETADGSPLPYRETLIAVTFAVILFTLVVQGLTMPAVVRWARLPPDPTEEWENLLAERTALEAVIEQLPRVAEEAGATPAVRDALLEEYTARLDTVSRRMRDDDKTVLPLDDELTGDDGESALRLAVLPVKRRAIAQLRNTRQIDDVVLRRIQARLDAEELRLEARAGDLDEEV